MAEFIQKIAQTPGLKAVFNYENFRLQPALDAKAQAAFIRPSWTMHSETR
jgi:hypothetical protein